MTIKENDSRRSEFKEYLDKLTKGTVPKQWMMLALVNLLESAFNLVSDDAEQFCQEWLNEYHEKSKG